MRVVLDTNVFISGIFWSGPPYEILKAWQNNKIRLILTQEILEEYHRVAATLSAEYPSIKLDDFIELLTLNSEICFPKELSQKICRDPDDEKFIACALGGKANILISGDKDLLEIPKIYKLTVIKPKQFCCEYLNLR